mmetsp:Transcript_8841/g.17265  ORF Transcript_8841/g.17265 Transcript_8841/m.17265 type:complete len:307 (+) Transcript_8841:89-1009(+)
MGHKWKHIPLLSFSHCLPPLQSLQRAVTSPHGVPHQSPNQTACVIGCEREIGEPRRHQRQNEDPQPNAVIDFCRVQQRIETEEAFHDNQLPPPQPLCVLLHQAHLPASLPLFLHFLWWTRGGRRGGTPTGRERRQLLCTRSRRGRGGTTTPSPPLPLHMMRRRRRSGPTVSPFPPVSACQLISCSRDRFCPRASFTQLWLGTRREALLEGDGLGQACKAARGVQRFPASPVARGNLDPLAIQKTFEGVLQFRQSECLDTLPVQLLRLAPLLLLLLCLPLYGRGGRCRCRHSQRGCRRPPPSTRGRR